MRCAHDLPYEGTGACQTCGPAFADGLELAAQEIADFVDAGPLGGAMTVVDDEPVRAAAARAIRRAFVRRPYVRGGALQPPPGGTFKVIKVDPEGSGMDWGGHLGITLRGAERCCKRCTVIFGYHHGIEMGPFIRGELQPLDDEAKRIYDEIEAFAMDVFRIYDFVSE